MAGQKSYSVYDIGLFLCDAEKDCVQGGGKLLSLLSNRNMEIGSLWRIHFRGAYHLSYRGKALPHVYFRCRAVEQSLSGGKEKINNLSVP